MTFITLTIRHGCRSGAKKLIVIAAEYIVSMTEYMIEGNHDSTKIELSPTGVNWLEVEETQAEILLRIKREQENKP